MDWEFVREVMLSVNRELFKDGEEAFEVITSERWIGNLVKNLERVHGLVFVDWVYILEWHEDGFPHWHLFFETEDPGKKGQIGYEKIKSLWGEGSWVTEGYIKNEEHWKNITGYFDKHGYFGEGKGHQGKLPKWAMEWDKQIRRWNGKRRKTVSDSGGQGEEGETLEGKAFAAKVKEIFCEGKEKRVRKPYSVILEKCGSESVLTVVGPGINEIQKVNIPYDFLKDFYPWEYVKGKGLVIELTEQGYEDFRKVVFWLDECGAGNEGGWGVFRGEGVKSHGGSGLVSHQDW
jgi:hypothetical protein